MEKSLNKSYHNLRRTNQDENGFNINKDAFSQNPDLRVERIFNTFNSALELANSLKEKNVTNMVGHMMRYQDTFRQCKKINI